MEIDDLYIGDIVKVKDKDGPYVIVDIAGIDAVYLIRLGETINFLLIVDVKHIEDKIDIPVDDPQTYLDGISAALRKYREMYGDTLYRTRYRYT